MHHDSNKHPDPVHHIIGVPVYVTIFLLLLVGTAITVAAAFVNLGILNTPIALAIATAKATVVVLYFMHVRYSTRLTWVIVIASVVWVGVLFALTFTDYLTRAWLTTG